MMARRRNPIDRRSAEVRAQFFEQPDPTGERRLLVVVEAAPPLFELVGELDHPHQPEYEPTLLMSQDSCLTSNPPLGRGPRSRDR